MKSNFTKKTLLSGGLFLSMIASTGLCVMAQESETELQSTYSSVIEVKDWGATITKLVVDMGREVTGEIKTDSFRVEVERSDERGEEPLREQGERKVTGAYVSDEEGNPLEKGSHVSLELEYGPDLSLGNALNYAEGSNAWIDCNYTITQEKDIGDISGVVASECTGSRKLEIEEFDIGSGSYEGVDFSIADYKPEENGEKRPLIIWLHGGGEGGTDATIPLAANRAVSFASQDIQNYFGGAYVLVPQCPTFWMEGQNGMADGTSIYEDGLMSLIQDYVNKNENIDKNRIYVGGCSNGGYMTMLLMRDYPEYFAAAYPVCEGLGDSLVTDENINTYKNQNIWFVLSATDETLDPLVFSVPTYIRLKEAGAENVHMTLFSKVSDTSGKYKKEDGQPYEYDGHWSWTYVYNDKVNANVEGNEISLLSWLSEQKLGD